MRTPTRPASASRRSTVVVSSNFTPEIVSLTNGLPVHQVMRHTRRVIRQPPGVRSRVSAYQPVPSQSGLPPAALRTRRQPPLQKLCAPSPST